MIRTLFFFLLVIINSNAFSKEKAFVLLDAKKNDFLIDRDISYFKRTTIKNNLLEKYFNLKTNQRNELINWLKKEGLVVLGSEFDYSFCLDKRIGRKMNIPCNDNHNPRVIQAKSAVKSYLLDRNYSLFFPRATLDKINATGGFILKNGKYIRLKNYSPVIVIEEELKSKSKRLNEEALSLYRFAHYAGLTRVKEIFKQRKKDWSYCDDINKKIACNRNLSGSYSLTGTLLYEFAKSCSSCSEKDITGLNYYAANYLLRIPGRNDFQLLGRNIFLSNKENMKRFLPGEYINMELLYKWALRSRLSAR